MQSHPFNKQTSNNIHQVEQEEVTTSDHTETPGNFFEIY